MLSDELFIEKIRKIFRKIYLGKLLGWASTLYARVSISIIGLKGVWIVPLKSRTELQTRLGPLLKFQTYVVSGEKTWDSLSMRNVLSLYLKCT